MNIQDVTIIVIPRERFSMARESLESLFSNTPPGFSLIYIDANSTPPVRSWIKTEQAKRGFRVISTDRFLPNNHARNLGLSEVTTPIAVITDNDLIFAPGWLEAMMRCADETGADVVAPLLCEGFPAHTTVHYAGGEYVPTEELVSFHTEKTGQRELREKQYLLKQPLARWITTLKRGPTGFCEPHCILARMSLLARIGPQPFDQNMLATKEHLDFCMSVREVGGTIFFEPAAMVTFMVPNPARPLQRDDLPFYLLRWSDEWQHRSLDHFRKKWRLEKTDFRKRYVGSGYRREDLIRIQLRRIPLAGRSVFFVEQSLRVVRRFEKMLNRRYVLWHDRRPPATIAR